jgi:putative endonuclease
MVSPIHCCGDRSTLLAAIVREKTIKAWKRRWKLELIEAMNPNWRDLYPDLL